MKRRKPDLLIVLAFLLSLGVVVTSYGANRSEKIAMATLENPQPHAHSKSRLSKHGK